MEPNWLVVLVAQVRLLHTIESSAFSEQLGLNYSCNNVQPRIFPMSQLQNPQPETVGTATTSGPVSLPEMFMPGCQLGLEDLKAFGLSIDVNPSGLWRLIGNSTGSYRNQPRALFPVWFNELLISVEKNAMDKLAIHRHDRQET